MMKQLEVASFVRATLLGFGAILLWSALAALTAAAGDTPPFQLAAMTFALGGGLGAASWLRRPDAVRALRQPWPVWLLGVGGLFGYHALYFASLRLAPPAEASLIAYLWPLLIVLFAAFLPGGRLHARHLAGAVMGFAGVAVLMAARGGQLSLDSADAPGYALALACAFTWAGYSVLSRRFGHVPTDAVVGFCLATALLSAAAHLAFETTVWPRGAGQWLAVLALGLGPVGAAFYLWDVGVKKGDITLLGIGSNAAPLLSTLILIATGFADPSVWLLLAAVLVVGGALVSRGFQGRRAAQAAQ
ncbi:DMT family transporter [Alsobacter sp. SYSU M60028]|uniref:DMT family transporter n=1 Tax=Alsobacter ponti TaxID=2962936 RepID=A0ABT1LCU0_9HYPH|nr:DMT family transporter [Alsobacter ponti]MCP8938893.1 DMT family transporter [Alsobacter ponti]